jgi:hypothetical protein
MLLHLSSWLLGPVSPQPAFSKFVLLTQKYVFDLVTESLSLGLTTPLPWQSPQLVGHEPTTKLMREIAIAHLKAKVINFIFLNYIYFNFSFK